MLTHTLPDTGREVCTADSDWSPERGPLDAKGITYAQELVRALFGNYRTAAAELGRDDEYARTVGALRERLGAPAAVAEMLLHSRPGHLELLPALPDAWAGSGSLTGAGARGGFVVDLSWRDGKPTEVRIQSVGGTMTSVGYAGRSRTVRLKPGESVTLKDLAR